MQIFSVCSERLISAAEYYSVFGLSGTVCLMY